MNVLILIPARYASTRFPGKPLAEIGGKPMIQHVVEKAQLVSQDAFVATDDRRIYDRVVGFGGKVVMTSADHKSGTDRCCEAYRHIVADYRKKMCIRDRNSSASMAKIRNNQLRFTSFTSYRAITCLLYTSDKDDRFSAFSVSSKLRWFPIFFLSF